MISILRKRSDLSRSYMHGL